MTAHQYRVLETVHDDDNALVYERGSGWWCGCERLDGKTAWVLIRAMLVTTTEDSSIDPWYLKITDHGERALRDQR